MSQIIFHIDVNSAFLSWTAIKLLSEGYPDDIRTILSAIGGDKEKRHGIILAKSVPAKAYHVTTGEPIVSALKKCPELQLFPPDHAYYTKCSKALLAHLSGYTSDLEQLSIDECFMDYTPIQSFYESPEQAAQIIKDSVYDTLGFSVNIGISCNKILAKMASDFKKPNLVHTLYPYEIQEKMWPLPVSELYMAGKSSVRVLHNLGINTIGELANTPSELLQLHLKSHGRLLWEYANGIDNTSFTPEPVENKGIGNSTTLATDVTSLEDACHVLLDLSETVAIRLRKAHMKASLLSVEIKYSNFTKASHQMQLDIPTDNAMLLYKKSIVLFKKLWTHAPIRLLGIRISKLTDASEPEQLSLFTEQAQATEKLRKVDEAMDSIRQKFGKNAVLRASFLKSPQTTNSGKFD